MLHNPLAHLPGQVEPGKVGIAALELGYDPQGLFVMVKAPVIFHQLCQGHLARVSKGRMPQVMCQADRLGQVLACSQGACHAAPDLCDLQCVCEACAVVITFIIDEYLRLIFEAAEGGRMQDSVTVALECGAILSLVLGVGAASRATAAQSIGGNLLIFKCFELLASI